MGKPKRLSSGEREVDTERKRQAEDRRLGPAGRAERDRIYQQYAEAERNRRK